MDNIDWEVLHTANRWLLSGRGVVLVTVVQTWGSAPRPVGSLAAISDDGRVTGSVSGGCVEDDLLERSRLGLLPTLLPQALTYGVDADEAQRFGLPCGGTLQLVLEPLGDLSALPALIALMERSPRVCRELDMATGTVKISEAAQKPPPPHFEFDGQVLRSMHGPRYRLLIIGAGQMSFYLANFAVPLGYYVTVCDPREAYALEWQVAGTQLVTDMPDDVVLEMRPDRHTAVVALTHDPKLDDLALIDALRSDAFYVGAIGSRSNRQKRAERLKLFDVTDVQLSRLHSPVGLYLGAKTPAEIAMSILAEMTAARHAVPVLQSHGLRMRHDEAVRTAYKLADEAASDMRVHPVDPTIAATCPNL